MKRNYRLTRRGFLCAALGGAVGFRHLLTNIEAAAQGVTAPKRLMVFHHPVGAIRNNWLPTGSADNFELSRILAPFEPVKDKMVVIDGMDLKGGGPGGGHEKGTVVLMTGVPTAELYPGNGGDDPKAEGPSIDQIILNGSPSLQEAPIASLQVSGDDRVDAAEVSTRRLSYSDRHSPMAPYLVPHLAYERVFGGSLMPGGDQQMEDLQRARAEQASVLDFAKSDLTRLRTLAPNDQLEKLDAFESAVRELETELDRDPTDPAFCGVAEEPPVIDPFTQDINGYNDVNTNDQDKHEQIVTLHLEVIRAALRCDLTRTITFQFSPGTNHVSFGGMWPDDENRVRQHHPVSHEAGPSVDEFLTRIDTWYSQLASNFFQSLVDTEDAVHGGSLMDTTLIPYVTEVARANHSYDRMPISIFGGAGTGLVGGRFMEVSRGRPLNDMWLAVARAMDVELTSLGTPDMYTEPLDILA